MHRLTPALALYAAACSCGDGKALPPCELESTDIRVDTIPEASDETESDGTLLCVSPTGNLYVAWVDDRGGVPEIWFNSSTDGGLTWLSSDVLVNQGEDGADSESNIFQPAIACTDDQVYVAWEDDRDGDLQQHNIYFQVSSDHGETWTEQDLMLDDDADGRFFSGGPFIAAVDDDVYVAWFDGRNGSFDIYLAASEDAGATFGAPVRVDSDQAGDAYSGYPRIAAQSDGTVLVVWEDSRSGELDIYVNRSVNRGGVFGIDVRLDEGDVPGAFNSFTPQIAADGDNVYVVWFDARNALEPEGPRDIYANYSSNGGLEWLGTAQPVEDLSVSAPGFFNSRFPVVAVNGNEAIVAWEDFRNQGYDIFARRLVNGTPDGPETRLDGGNTGTPSPPGLANSLGTRMAAAGSNVVVLWSDDRSVTDDESGFSDIYYNCSSDFGKSWDTEDRRIDNVEAGKAYKNDLNVAIVGETILAAWSDGREGSSDIYVHTLAKGTEADYAIKGNPDECVIEDAPDEEEAAPAEEPADEEPTTEPAGA